MAKNIRIAFLAKRESVHTEKWISYFAEKGYDVHLITLTSHFNSFTSARVKPIKGVKIHELKHFGRLTTNIAYPLMILKIWKAIKKISPDILHAHYVLHYGSYGAFIWFKPFVITVWGSDILIDPYKSMMNRFFVNHALKKADLITCDAKHMMRALKQMGVIPEKISLIHFGVDTKKFSPRKKSEKLRVELGINESLAVISLRNLEPLYDVESLIRSVPLVLKKVPESRFVIAGRGSEETKLKELTISLGVSDNVMFVGFIQNEEIPEWLNTMDVCVSTSLSDAGIAASTAEAMACGLPVIVTDVADNKKWVEDGVNGFLVPIKDPKSLAEKIIYLLENDDIRKKFGKISRKIIEERNNYYKEMEKMEAIYEELVRRHEK